MNSILYSTIIERVRQTDTHTDKQTDRQSDRQTEIETERQRERYREIQRQRERYRKIHRQREMGAAGTPRPDSGAIPLSSAIIGYAIEGVTLCLRASLHRRCQHPPKGLGTDKTVEAT